MIKDRINLTHDLWEQSAFFFHAPVSYDDKTKAKCWKENTPEIIQRIAHIIENTIEFTATALETNIKGFLNNESIGLGQAMLPLRLLLVGSSQGPDLFAIMQVLGKEETLTRIKKGITTL